MAAMMMDSTAEKDLAGDGAASSRGLAIGHFVREVQFPNINTLQLATVNPQ
jgi:hypothetical protein